MRIGLVDGQGTAIGNALGTAINRLRKSTAKSKVIVLVTDGDDNASKLDPRKAAKFAQTFGVKVFTILIGRDVLAAEAPPGQDRFGNMVAPAAALSGQPQAARGDRRAPPAACRSSPPTPRRCEKRFQAILEDLDRSQAEGADAALRRALPDAGRAGAACWCCSRSCLSLTRFRRFP